jgi:peptide deformylase
MAIRKVAVMGNPILRRVAAEVPPDQIGDPEVQRLIDDLVETMREYEGAGIAAPQVYEPLRICVIEEIPRDEDDPGVPFLVLVNPKVTPLTDVRSEFWEGCLSVPDLRGLVARPRHVHVDAYDRQGRALAFDAEGFFATVLQHETDHLNGILFVDRVEDTRTLAFTRELRRHRGVESSD